MSLILDALKKSESERREHPATSSDTGSIDQEEESKSPWRAIMLGMLLFTMLGALGVIKFMVKDPPIEEVVAKEQTAVPVETATPVPTSAPTPTPTSPPAEKPSSPESQKTTEVATVEPVQQSEPVAKEPVSTPPEPLAKVIEKAPQQPATPVAQAPTPAPVVKEAAKQEVPHVQPLVVTAPRPVSSTPPVPRFSPPVKPTTSPPPPAVLANPDLAIEHLKQAEAFEKNGQVDLAIEAYGRAIEQDSENAEAFYARGWTHQNNRSFDLAIDDFTEAVRLRINFVDAYVARAWAYEQSGNRVAAISDYSNVIRFEPDNMNATLSRGILKLYSDQQDQSEVDFQKVYERADAELSDYGLLWMYVGRLRRNFDTSSVAADFSKIRPQTSWPGILFRSFIGDASATEVITAMRASGSLTARKRQCVGYFFLGQYRLAVGDTSGARDYFTKTLESGITSYRQYWAAKIELERLDGPQ